MNNQQMHSNFIMYFYLFAYVHQHVSASYPAIFRVMIQGNNCSWICHHHSIILKMYIVGLNLTF